MYGSCHSFMVFYHQAVKLEKVRLTQETKDLQASMSLLKGSHHTEADWKRIESQHKVFTLLHILLLI